MLQHQRKVNRARKHICKSYNFSLIFSLHPYRFIIMSHTRPTLAVFTFSCLAMLSTTALSAVKIGVVGAADRHVTAISAKGEQRTITLGDDIFQNDTIKTDNEGKVQLVFKDRSTITINKNSEITIDKYVYNGSDNDEMGIKSVKGAFRFIGGALSKKKPVNIKTPVATIGIRGGIADTNIGEGGKTDAVFIYGDQMTISNLYGETETTTQYGSGFTLQRGNSLPVSLPSVLVDRQLNNFMHKTGRGGGMKTPPAPADIDVMMKNTLRHNTSSNFSTSTQPKTASTVTPIIMVNDNVSVMETMDMTSMIGENMAQQQLTDRINRSEDDISLLQTITNTPINPNIGSEVPNQESAVDNIDDIIITNTTMIPPENNSITLENNEINQVATLPINTNVLQAETSPINLTPDAIESATGAFWSINKNNKGTNLNVILESERVNVASNTVNSITLTLQDDGSGISTVVIPKNIINGTVQTYEENGVISTRIYNKTESDLGGFKVIRSQDTLDNNIQTNFVLGHEISPENIESAAQRSVEFSNENPDSRLNSNGILTYRTIPNIARENSGFGGPNHERDTIHIDWNNRNGAVGNTVGGYVGWMDEGTDNGKSHVVFGNVKDGTLTRLQYGSTSSSGNSITPGTTEYAALGNGTFFGKEGNPVEGLALEFETIADDNIATWNASQDFNSSNTTNNGVSAFVLRDTIDENYAYATSNGVPDSTVTKKGFAAGTILRSNASAHDTAIFHNSDVNDVQFQIGNNGSIKGNIRTHYEDDNFSNNTINATFANGTYLNNKLFAAQQSEVEYNNNRTITNADGSKAFIVGANLINDAQANVPGGSEYQCDDCKFVSWGVWAGDLGNRTGNEASNDYANLVPYVVGDVTQNLSSQTDLIGKTGTYRGEAYGQLVNTAGSTENIVGNVDADITFTDGGSAQTLQTDVTRLDLNFPSQNVHLQLNAPASVAGTGDAVFNGTLTQANGNSLNSSSINGAVFGTDASELGGNFEFERTNGASGGGVFFGKQRELN